MYTLGFKEWWLTIPKDNKGRKSRKGGRSRSPSVFSAAGLVRYYEEADVGIKLKPALLIILSIIFTAVIILLNKLPAR